jgi:hypothetical protein
MHTYSYIDTYVHAHIDIYKLYTYANKNDLASEETILARSSTANSDSLYNDRAASTSSASADKVRGGKSFSEWVQQDYKRHVSFSSFSQADGRPGAVQNEEEQELLFVRTMSVT